MRNPDSDHRYTQQGFTIVEVLVAVMLLLVIVTAVLAPLTGLFGLSRQSTQQVAATNLAQAAIEQVKGEWQDSPKYQMNCVSLTSFPAGVQVRAQGMDSNFNKVGSETDVQATGTACGVSPALPDTSPTNRTVTASATSAGKTVSFSTEIAHP
ncbi:prepilin-type N-terminal cleavage/methylation domain-containing protein [Deinococcus aquaticus]|uniref:Prepilin-type N-terminal cleavage/methylation domain-containing protein n=1 Tax=Deinococcus aquaticus TaxID=328692 RepID=A0ABY7V704_9DEIO|nr:prepilin-type N-terminal cleavage/methylation domain-containing protein [Deinococcus aquaticus]WDA59801.1 prepilin-type N-terminal cleavage/methylation domain-containing protein [Deinococcus aquaticus]